MRNFDSFKTFFDANMHGTLEAIEHRRLTMFKSQTKMGVWAVGMFLMHIAFIYLGILHKFTLPLTLLISPSVAYYLYRKYYVDLTITNDFKKAVVGKMIDFFGESLSYDPDKFIDYEDFRDSELIMLRPDHYAGDDYIEGDIDGIPIEFSELEIQYEDKSSTKKKPTKKPKWDTAFHGIFLVATIPNPIQGKMIILPSKLEKKLGFAGRLLHENNLMRGTYVSPKNPKFRESFVTYTNNILEAEQLLSEELMDRLLMLQNISKSDVYASFKEDKIYIALNTMRDFFSVKINQSLINPNYLRQFYFDFTNMLDIIDEINIDELTMPEPPKEDPMPEEAYETKEPAEETPDLGAMNMEEMGLGDAEDLGDIDMQGHDDDDD